MKTQQAQPCRTGPPWLEHYPEEGTAAEQFRLDPIPFTVGRNESADLKIDSPRVSREHAVLVQEEGRYRVEDLGSTNGTFVNGLRVEKAALEDGDVVLFADSEFTFFCGNGEGARRTVTEPMQAQDPAGDGSDSPLDLIGAVRQLQEALVHRCVTIRFRPIVRLADGGVFGYEALGEDNEQGHRPASPEKRLLPLRCRLADRTRYVQRLVAVEEVSTLADECSLFLGLRASEVGTTSLCESLARLQGVLPERHRLVVGVPDRAFGDPQGVRDFRRRLQELDIDLAYDGFAAGEAQVVELREIRPDFLKLAQPLARRIHDNPERQRRLRSAVRASQDIGSEVIATGLDNQQDAATCRQVGCRFGQGASLGRARTSLAPLLVDNLQHEP